MSDNNVRINKFLSQAGFCSRREADQYIIDGRVTINGDVAEMGAKITLDDKVSVAVSYTHLTLPTKRIV